MSCTFYRFFILRNYNLHKCHYIRSYSVGSKLEILEWYKELGVENGSDQETVRLAYLELAKKYHPDSGKSSSCAERFQKIDEAYKNLQTKFAQERWNTDEGEGEYGLYYEEKEEEKDFGIKHTVPQHRQYLSTSGSGTMYERLKHTEKARVAAAVTGAAEYRMARLSEDKSQKALIYKQEKKKAKDVKTGLGIDRLVEDMIQESMSKGEFSNLKGSGKPLSNFRDDNPYVDFVTHKMNQVLIDNGFTPTWITLQKEIRESTTAFRERLATERRYLGPLPLNLEESIAWQHAIERVVDDINALNEKIDNYNLLVPILQKQMFHINLEREAEEILKLSPDRTSIPDEPSKEVCEPPKSKAKVLLGKMLSVFNRSH